MASQANIQELEKIASQVRRDIVRMVHAVNSGHPGGSFRMHRFFCRHYYFHILKHNVDFDMNAKNEDLFSYQTAIFRQFGIAFWPEVAISNI